MVDICAAEEARKREVADAIPAFASHLRALFSADGAITKEYRAQVLRAINAEKRVARVDIEPLIHDACAICASKLHGGWRTFDDISAAFVSDEFESFKVPLAPWRRRR